MDIMIEQDKYLSDLLDKHAPKNNIYNNNNNTCLKSNFQ